MRHLTTLCDLQPDEFDRIFAITDDLKAKYDQGLREALLPGRVLALLFEKPSLRTRVSFEAGIAHLGGSSMLLGEEVGFGHRESIDDFGRVLSQYVDVIVLRSKEHQTVLSLAKHADCPVINGLTDRYHPCQAMADLYTLRELLGSVEGKKLAFVGDSNNMVRSLAIGCGKVGMRLAVASPEAYQLTDDFLALLAREVPDAQLEIIEDPTEAVADAAAVYTDVWASMGQEKQKAARCRDFADYQVNADLMAHAPDDAYFMHCLPAHRGEEVTNEVIDSPASVVVQQAANRLHVQKGILVWLLGTQKR